MRGYDWQAVIVVLALMVALVVGALAGLAMMLHALIYG